MPEGKQGIYSLCYSVFCTEFLSAEKQPSRQILPHALNGGNCDDRANDYLPKL